jgi:hypothetical protein
VRPALVHAIAAVAQLRQMAQWPGDEAADEGDNVHDSDHLHDKGTSASGNTSGSGKGRYACIGLHARALDRLLASLSAAALSFEAVQLELVGARQNFAAFFHFLGECVRSHGEAAQEAMRTAVQNGEEAPRTPAWRGVDVRRVSAFLRCDYARDRVGQCIGLVAVPSSPTTKTNVAGASNASLPAGGARNATTGHQSRVANESESRFALAAAALPQLATALKAWHAWLPSVARSVSAAFRVHACVPWSHSPASLARSLVAASSLASSSSSSSILTGLPPPLSSLASLSSLSDADARLLRRLQRLPSWRVPPAVLEDILASSASSSHALTDSSSSKGTVAERPNAATAPVKTAPAKAAAPVSMFAFMRPDRDDDDEEDDQENENVNNVSAQSAGDADASIVSTVESECAGNTRKGTDGDASDQGAHLAFDFPFSAGYTASSSSAALPFTSVAPHAAIRYIHATSSTLVAFCVAAPNTGRPLLMLVSFSTNSERSGELGSGYDRRDSPLGVARHGTGVSQVSKQLATWCAPTAEEDCDFADDDRADGQARKGGGGGSVALACVQLTSLPAHAAIVGVDFYGDDSLAVTCRAPFAAADGSSVVTMGQLHMVSVDAVRLLPCYFVCHFTLYEKINFA